MKNVLSYEIEEPHTLREMGKGNSASRIQPAAVPGCERVERDGTHFCAHTQLRGGKSIFHEAEKCLGKQFLRPDLCVCWLERLPTGLGRVSARNEINTSSHLCYLTAHSFHTSFPRAVRMVFGRPPDPNAGKIFIALLFFALSTAIAFNGNL